MTKHKLVHSNISVKYPISMFKLLKLIILINPPKYLFHYLFKCIHSNYITLYYIRLRSRLEHTFREFVCNCILAEMCVNFSFNVHFEMYIWRSHLHLYFSCNTHILEEICIWGNTFIFVFWFKCTHFKGYDCIWKSYLYLHFGCNAHLFWMRCHS